MKNTYGFSCKLCQWHCSIESSFWPLCVLEHLSCVWFFCHLLRRHIKKMRLLHFWYGVKHFGLLIFSVLLFFVLATVMTILYPLWWLLDKLYN